MLSPTRQFFSIGRARLRPSLIVSKIKNQNWNLRDFCCLHRPYSSKIKNQNLGTVLQTPKIITYWNQNWSSVLLFWKKSKNVLLKERFPFDYFECFCPDFFGARICFRSSSILTIGTSSCHFVSRHLSFTCWFWRDAFWIWQRQYYRLHSMLWLGWWQWCLFSQQQYKPSTKEGERWQWRGRRGYWLHG